MAGTSRKANPKIVEVPSMDSLGHRQPQNLEMETAVLGALMNEQDAFGQVAEILRPAKSRLAILREYRHR